MSDKRMEIYILMEVPNRDQCQSYEYTLRWYVQCTGLGPVVPYGLVPPQTERSDINFTEIWFSMLIQIGMDRCYMRKDSLWLKWVAREWKSTYWCTTLQKYEYLLTLIITLKCLVSIKMFSELDLNWSEMLGTSFLIYHHWS